MDGTKKLSINDIKKIRDSASKFSTGVISKIKTGTKAAVATKVGKVAGKFANAVVGPGVDVIMGGVQITSSAQEVNVSDSRKAYNIVGDIAGTGANIAASLLTGPFAILIIAAQIVGAILDAAWNPFKNYFNSDLETMRLGIIDSLKVAYREANMNYPIETKPDILSSLSDPNSEESKEYINIMDTYLKDRGFITSEEVRAEEEYFLALKTIKRQRKLYRINANGELEMQDPNLAAIALFDNATNNDLVMMALAAKYAQNKKLQSKENISSNDIRQQGTNYIIGASVISTIFLIFFFLSIFIANI